MPPNSEIEKLERRWKENPKGTVFAPYAEVLRKNGDYLVSKEVLRQGLELHPDHIPGNIVLGRCHLDLKEDGPAEAAFTHVLDLDQENVIALKALADITERQGRLAEASEWLRRLISVDPSNEEAMDQLGRVSAVREAAAAEITRPMMQMTPPRPSPAVQLPDAGSAPSVSEATVGEIQDLPESVDAAVDSALDAFEIATPPAPMMSDPIIPVREPVDPEASTAPSMPVYNAPATPLEDLQATEFDASAVGSLAAEPLPGIEPDEPFTVPAEPAPLSADPLAEVASTYSFSAPVDVPAPSVELTGDPEIIPLGVEQLSTIDLRPSSSSEFQAPDASQDMLDLAAGASEFQEADPAQELLISSAGGSEYQTPSGADQLLAAAGAQPELPPLEDLGSTPMLDEEPETEPAAPPPSWGGGVVTSGFAAISMMPTAEMSTEPPAGLAPLLSEPHEPPVDEPAAAAPPVVEIVDDVELTEPLETSVAQVGEIPEEEPGTSSSDLRLIMPDAPEEVETHTVRRISQETPAITAAQLEATEAELGQPAPVLTETMAELYARQGHTAEALNVYRQLHARQPNDRRLAERVRELEAQQAAGSRRLSYVAVETGGESVESFFRSLVEARPGGGAGAPVTSSPAASMAATDGGTGAPTRPTSDPLSLSAIFGEEPAPRPVVAEPAAPQTPDAFSFDQFFGGATPGSAIPGGSIRTGTPRDEDLDQFQNWLKSLKR